MVLDGGIFRTQLEEPFHTHGSVDVPPSSSLRLHGAALQFRGLRTDKHLDTWNYGGETKEQIISLTSHNCNVLANTLFFHTFPYHVYNLSLLNITYNESQITNHESQITNHESQVTITNNESQIANHESLFTNDKSRIINHVHESRSRSRSRITNHKQH